MGMDSVPTVAQNIINRYKARNPHPYDGGEESINELYLEDLIGEILAQLAKASVAPGGFKDTDNNSSITGVGGPVT